jgi:NAD(P)-dependent dehydrogenase (short-subunit alcohol dehydrogenase family)
MDVVTAWGGEPDDETGLPAGSTYSGSPFDLDGRVALVTGAGGGLGQAFSRALAQAGASIVCADLDGHAAEQTAKMVRAMGRAAGAVELDVTAEEAVDRVFAGVADEFGHLDVLVNNAGIGDPRSVPLHRVRTDDWRRVLDVDLGGVFFCSRAALRLMVTQGHGKIVNIASMFGMTGARIAPIPAYAPAKGAVVNLTRELGLQYATAGIQVNALCPGFVRTGLSNGVYHDDAFLARLSGMVPMGRIAAPVEMTGALLLLASSASDYMTGQTIVVDGGCTAG